MIRFLEPSVAALIAAGEVIHGPRDVLKELIENSLDAQAKNLQIDLTYGGLESICVRDDGIGLSESDLRLSIEKYATSKIRHISDLENLETFGFRGEGLFSICTVSNLTIRTRQLNAEIGFELVSVLPDKTPQVHPCGSLRLGTEVICANLFAPIPVRRKLLKNNSLETKRACDRVRALVLLQHHLHVQLKNNGKILLELSSVSEESLLTRILEAYPQTQRKDWMAQEQIFDSGRIRAWYYPDHTKGLEQIWTINKRWVAQSSFLKVAQRFVQQGILIVSLELFARDIDVNIHPQKHQVGLFKEDAILHTIVDFLQNFLGQYLAQDYGLDQIYQPRYAEHNQSFSRSGRSADPREHISPTFSQPRSFSDDFKIKNFEGLSVIHNHIEESCSVKVIPFNQTISLCIYKQDVVVIDRLKLKDFYDLGAQIQERAYSEPEVLVEFQKTQQHFSTWIKQQPFFLMTIGSKEIEHLLSIQGDSGL